MTVYIIYIIMQNIAKIDNNLFLGSLFSTTIETLKENKITYIFHFGFQIAKPNLNDSYFLENCKHEYFNLEDTPESTEQMLKISDYIVKKIDELINKGETVLVCCVAGKSRSASIVTLYLHYKYPNASYEDIIDFILKRRDISINKGFSVAIKQKINEDRHK